MNAWIIALNAAGWPVIQSGMAWVFTKLPVVICAGAASLPCILARRTQQAFT